MSVALYESTINYFICSFSEIEVLHSHLENPKPNTRGKIGKRGIELFNGSFKTGLGICALFVALDNRR